MRCFDLLLYQCALFLPVCPVSTSVPCFLRLCAWGCGCVACAPHAASGRLCARPPAFRAYAAPPPAMCSVPLRAPCAHTRAPSFDNHYTDPHTHQSPTANAAPTHQSPTANAAPTHKNSQKVQMKGCFFFLYHAHDL